MCGSPLSMKLHAITVLRGYTSGFDVPYIVITVSDVDVTVSRIEDARW
jgi:hypothetical protein